MTVPHPGPTVDPEVLTAVAATCRDAQQLRFDYRTREGVTGLRTVEPHRLVHVWSRWYLLAWDVDRDDWRIFRVDRMRPRSPAGRRLTHRDPPDPDAATYVASRLSSGWGLQARIVVHEPAASLRARLWSGWGEVTERDAMSCVLTVQDQSVSSLAIHVLLLDADVEVEHPPELVGHLRLLGARIDRAVSAATAGT